MIPGGRRDLIRHLKRALKAGDVTVLLDTCEYDSRLEGVLKKSVKIREGRVTNLVKNILVTQLDGVNCFVRSKLSKFEFFGNKFCHNILVTHLSSCELFLFMLN